MTRQAILDRGYVEPIGTWGSEEQIIEAARMSTHGGFRGWPADEKLLGYLWRNKHHTPFEMAGLTIEVQAPIFVIREWQRHRTLGFNEASARYAPLPCVNYVPTMSRLRQEQDGKNRQAGAMAGAEELTITGVLTFQDELAHAYEYIQRIYERSLAMGVPKELARLVLPVGRYSRMRVTGNLRNWLAFLKLRLDNAAQYEIRVYAEEVGKIIAANFPRTWVLFVEGRQ